MALTRQALLDAVASGGGRGHTARELVQRLGAPRSGVRAVRAMLGGLVRSGTVIRRGDRYALAEAREAPSGPRRAARGEARTEARGRSGRVRRARARDEHGSGSRRGAGRRGRPGAPAASSAAGGRIGIVVPGRRGGVILPYPDDGSFVVHGAGALPAGTVVALADRGRRGLQPDAELGRAGDPDADFAAIAAAHALALEFPAAAEREARAAAARVPAAEIRRRVDLRALPLVTIDPASARDHDDAVAAWPLQDGGHRLLVAIADVAHYVAPGGALDREARERGNSVYFPDRAVPMLPERLASELCSLRPDEDRLAMAVELRFDAAGAVQRTSVYPAVIRSRSRLVYEAAAAAMAGERPQPDPEVQDALTALGALTARLTARRLREGSLDLELPETRIVLGRDGRPVDARPVPRSVAHRAVEEAMLAANRAVASLLDDAGQPALFRVHEAPDPEDLETVADALAGFGVEGRRAAALLLEGRVNRALRCFDPAAPETRGVHLLVLRAMKQARYAARDTGHYALAFDQYAHFTSPIRRYADLVVHRAVKAQLAGARWRAPGLAPLAAHLSGRERAAMAAERQMRALKAAVILAERRGQVTGGLVSGVIRQGVFVTRLEDGLDGFVPARDLGEGVRFDERRLTLRVRRPPRRLRLGDRVRVTVASADLARGRVRLALVDDAQGASARDSSSAARRSQSR